MFEGLSQGRRLRALVSDSAVYGLSGGLNKALALITFPLLARHFSVADFGTIDYANTIAVLLTTVLLFGSDAAAARFYYEFDAPKQKKQVVSQAMVYQLVIMAAVLPAGWVMAEPIARALGIDESHGATVVRLIIAQAPFFVLTTYALGLLKWTFRRWQFLLVSVGSTLVTIAALVIALALSRLDLVGVFVVYLITRALFGLAAIWLVRDMITWPSGFATLRLILPFAIPFGATCVIVALLPFIERSVVGYLIGPVALGYYAAGTKVAMLINLPVMAIETSWHPFSVSLHKEADAATTYNIVLKIVCFTLFAGVLAISSAADLVVELLGSSRYSGAGVVVFPLCMAAALQAVCSVAAIGSLLAKRSGIRLYSLGAMLLVSAVTIPLFASLFGIAGAAWGSLIGVLARTVIETWLAQKVWPIDWRFGGVTIVGLFTIGVGVVHQLTLERFTWLGLEPIPLAGSLVMVPLAWLVLLHAGERDKVLSILHTASSRLRSST